MSSYLINDDDSLKDFAFYLDEMKGKHQIGLDGRIYVGGLEFKADEAYQERIKDILNPKKSVAPKSETTNEAFLFGKDQTQNITALEIEDDALVVFTNDGKSSRRKANYYYLTSFKTPQATSLKGGNHYKFISQTDNYVRFKNALSQLRADKHYFSNPVEGMMTRDGISLYKGLKFNEVSVLAFDIETTTLSHNSEARVLIISNAFRDVLGFTTKKLFTLSEYPDQKTMIAAWAAWVQQIDPQVMVGHNIYMFDLPYLAYCHGKEPMLLGKESRPIRFAEKTKGYRREAGQYYDYIEPYVFGRQVVDTMFLAYKHDQASRKYESYRLKDIVAFEGMEKEGRELWDFHLHRPSDVYARRDTEPEIWRRFKEYALDDSDDALKLWDLMAPALFYLCQHVPLQLQTIVNTATGRWVNSFLIRSYLQDGYGIPKAEEKVKFGGGISYGNPGIYKHVYKVDVQSQYPSIIITFKIFNRIKDPSGNFLRMVEHFTQDRLNNKRLGETNKFNKDLSESQKIFINSAYGLLGTKGLNFNSMVDADFVTAKGREFVQMGCEWVSGRRLRREEILKKNGQPEVDSETGEIKHRWHIDMSKEFGGKRFQLVNADTDSFSYSPGKALTDDEFKEHIREINAMYPEGIKWANDGYYKKGIVIKAKNYVFQKKNDELIIKGGITSRAREKKLRDFLDRVIMLILGGKKEQIFHEYNREAKEVLNIQDMTDWCKTKTIAEKILTASTVENKKIYDAIQGKDYKEGDKAKVFYLSEKTMRVLEDFDGVYDKPRYLEKLYDTLCVFEGVLDTSLYPNYSLARNKALLET